jgi:ribosomal-protein-alanine N-acetyltransferase
MISHWLNKKNLVLEAGDVRLRLPRRADYEAWQNLRAKSRLFLKPVEPKWSDVDLTRNAYADRVRKCRDCAKKGTEFSMFIFSLEHGKEILVGGVTLSNIRYRAAHHANIGYWLGQEQVGNGYMVRAVSLLLKFAFESLNLKRIHAACLPDNVSSIKVLSRTGFAEEGFAQEYLQINGEWRDHLLYGLTASRYASINIK